jgi:lipopolysaccharide export system permease protein
LFRTFDRYVLREVAVSWLAVTLVLLAILASSQVARILELAAQNGFPREIVFSLIGLTTLQNLVLLVPIGVLLAAMLALGRLYHESAMVAVRACGVGPARLYLPVYALALPVAVGLAWLTFDLGPAARNGAEELRSKAMRDAQFGNLDPGIFRTFADGKAVFYAERRDSSKHLANVFVQRYEEGRVEVATADWAEQRVLEGGRTQLIVLHNGERVEGVPGRSDFRRVRFVEHGIPVVVPEPGPGRDSPARKPTSALIGSTALPDVAELQQRISMPIMVLVLALVAVPLAALRPREGRYARVAIAILIYFVYSNLVSASQVWTESGRIPPLIGCWWAHLLMVILGLVLLHRQSPLNFWRQTVWSRA